MRKRSLLLPTAAAIVVAAIALLVRHQAPAPSVQAAATSIRAGHVTVAITNYAFMPKSLTVKVGTRVTWTNHDATAHTATSDNGSFDTGTVNPSTSRTVDFMHPGTFTYHCAFHAFMTATITVKR